MASSRGQTWTHEEILALIRIWSDSAIQSRLDGASRTADIWRDVAERLRTAGFHRTSKQCNDKMKNLRQYYKDLKDGHNRSGHSRSNWPYYDLMDDVLGDRPSTRPRNIIDTTHSASTSISSSAPDSPSPDGSLIGERTSPDLFGTTPPQPPTPQSLDTGIIADPSDTEEEMPVVDQREEASPSVSGQTRPATSQPASRSKRPRLNALEKALSGVTEKFLEHQKEAEARVMLAIDEKQKREMELLEKMRKDDRDHELRLVQILGQMMFAQPPPTPSLYYPPPPVPQPTPVSEMPQTLPVQPVAGAIGMGYPQMHIPETDAHTSTYNSINN